MSFGWVARLREVENLARETCERYSETLDAALKKYDTYRQAVKDDTGSLMQLHTLLWHPIQLVSPLVGKEERKQNEILIAAALYRHMEEARELLRRQLNGARLLQVGVIVGELCLALRIPEIESNRARHDQKRARQTIDQKWRPVRWWCKKKALFWWYGGNTDSVPVAAKAFIEIIEKNGAEEFGVKKIPSANMVEDWIRPFAPASVKKPGRPKKHSN